MATGKDSVASNTPAIIYLLRQIVAASGGGGGGGVGFSTEAKQDDTITKLDDVLNLLALQAEISTGWVQDANGDLHWLETVIDESDGSVTYSYFDGPGGAPTGPVAPVAPVTDAVTRTFLGDEILNIGNGAVAPLAAIPVGANLAEIQVLSGNVWFRIGTPPAVNAGYYHPVNSHIELESVDELGGSFLADGAPALLFISYYNHINTNV